FRVERGRRAHLDRRDPGDRGVFPDRAAAEKQSKKNCKTRDELQDRLLAEGRRALLVVLQGSDPEGKDGTVRHVFKEASPLGVTVTSFRQPTWLEGAHHSSWSRHAAAPRRVTIGIFNRSHYEQVLVVRVRKLAPAE